MKTKTTAVALVAIGMVVVGVVFQCATSDHDKVFWLGFFVELVGAVLACAALDCAYDDGFREGLRLTRRYWWEEKQ